MPLSDTLEKTPLALAKEMSPEERARMVATAEGWGRMLIKRHEADNRAFSARWPGLVKVTQGFVVDGKRVGRHSMISVEATARGMEVAKQIQRCGLKIVWPEADDESS